MIRAPEYGRQLNRSYQSLAMARLTWNRDAGKLQARVLRTNLPEECTGRTVLLEYCLRCTVSF